MEVIGTSTPSSVLSPAHEKNGGISIDRDDEIRVDGQRVLWIRHGVLQKALTFDAPVLHVVWTRFNRENEEVVWSLCIAHRDALTILDIDGRTNTVPLPFEPMSILPLDRGLILARSPRSSRLATAPLLYTLEAPLRELQPIQFAEGEAPLPSHRLIFCGDSLSHSNVPIAATWCPTSRTVTAYEISAIRASARPSVGTLNPDGFGMSLSPARRARRVHAEAAPPTGTGSNTPPEVVLVAEDMRGWLYIVRRGASCSVLPLTVAVESRGSALPSTRVVTFGTPTVMSGIASVACVASEGCVLFRAADNDANLTNRGRSRESACAVRASLALVVMDEGSMKVMRGTETVVTLDGQFVVGATAGAMGGRTSGAVRFVAGSNDGSSVAAFRPHSLVSAAGDRVTIVCMPAGASSGAAGTGMDAAAAAVAVAQTERMCVRVRLTVTPRSSLGRRCLGAMRAILSLDEYALFQSAVCTHAVSLRHQRHPWCAAIDSAQMPDFARDGVMAAFTCLTMGNGGGCAVCSKVGGNQSGTDAPSHARVDSLADIIERALGESRDPGDSAWKALIASSLATGMSSSIHSDAAILLDSTGTGVTGGSTEPGRLQTPVIQQSQQTRPASHTQLLFLQRLVFVMHLVYEDAKLDAAMAKTLPYLGGPLLRAAAHLGLHAYADSYVRDLALASPPASHANPSGTCHVATDPPSVYAHIESAVRRTSGEPAATAFPSAVVQRGGDADGADGGLWLSSAVTRVFSAWADGPEAVVMEMARAGMHPGVDLDRLCPALSLPLRSAINQCAASPRMHWPSRVLCLIGRTDMAALIGGPTPAPRDAPAEHDVSRLPPSDTTARVDGTADLLSSDFRRRFPKDRRIEEAMRMLRSSVPIQLTLLQKPEMSDHDFIVEQQAQLLQFLQRALALSVGRGMLTLSTTLPEMGEQLVVPPLIMTGVSAVIGPSGNPAAITLEASALPDTMLGWPSFHNGVASSLRLMRPVGYFPAEAHTMAARRASAGVTGSTVSSTWIVYNRTGGTDGHAGFLLGLGLQGHLPALATANAHDYLRVGHEFTSIGILLGLAASKAGSCEPAVTRMLCLHIPALLPPSSAEVWVSWGVQTASLLGVGLLFRASANRRMAEVLLDEIGRLPGSDASTDRDSYSLTAGLALGLVTLGRGSHAAGLSDLRLVDRLRRYMDGGKVDMSSLGAHSAHGRGAYAQGTGGLAALASLVVGDMGSSSSAQVGTATAAGASARQRTGPQWIDEGDRINVTMTAPGAMLALGLMYHRTSDALVADVLALPATLSLLESIPPYHVTVRVLARSLVAWEAVAATPEWVFSQVPALSLDAARESGVLKERDVVVGTAAPSLFADAENASAAPPRKKHKAMSVGDQETLLAVFCRAVAGACLSVGLRYAGTAAEGPARYLAQWVRHLERVAASRASNNRAFAAGVVQCVDICALALACVLAGTGDVDCLRLLRRARARPCDSNTRYGNHMAVGMATGLLFLGGGMWAVGRTPEATASLVCALYPIFPLNPKDNRYHCQAFRHLYVLAAEYRALVARDSETGAAVAADVVVRMVQGADSVATFGRDGRSVEDGRVVIKATTPCILPEFSSIHSIEVVPRRSTEPDGPLPVLPLCILADSDAGRNLAKSRTLYVRRPSRPTVNPRTLAFGASTVHSQREAPAASLACIAHQPHAVLANALRGTAPPSSSLAAFAESVLSADDDVRTSVHGMDSDSFSFVAWLYRAVTASVGGRGDGPPHVLGLLRIVTSARKSRPLPPDVSDAIDAAEFVVNNAVRASGAGSDLANDVRQYVLEGHVPADYARRRKAMAFVVLHSIPRIVEAAASLSLRASLEGGGSEGELASSAGVRMEALVRAMTAAGAPADGVGVLARLIV